MRYIAANLLVNRHPICVVIARRSMSVVRKGGSRIGERGGGEVEAPQAPRGWGGVLGRGSPLPRNFFEFLSQNGAFLCILQSAAVILGSENAWRRGSVGFLS